jgi:hypothetical protein
MGCSGTVSLYARAERAPTAHPTESALRASVIVDA